MPISLFPHNQTAYESLLTVLETVQRACIIHPTGTGKSFIGFKYCEEHPTQAVLWLSPSAYIFKTQCESLLAAGAQVPENISYMTYAKLSQLDLAELNELRPDVIILDEMHRAAAPTWEKPVQALLARKPEPIAIGLTATNIRYLDGQKDTTVTFDMRIASEMTLGEALVRGILNPPKYVLSLFTYQNELDKYEARVRQARSKAMQDKGEELLDALRRALEKAEGMDAIFARHMPEANGKYIVFCANAEHMREMIGKAPKWFGKLDKHPHIYSAYSADPETSSAFASFKADESEHLKLLYCIDMLNEGIHVENVSGVILLRPTISPIVYKQQIGRALSAAKKQDAVIFDIVLNIENLYSIGAVEEEMELATAYYRSLGLESEIVNEHFKVVDEVRDCRELFAKLEETLVASWDLMYQEAKKYRAANGDLNVPRRYVTPEGYSLGSWLCIQRMVRDGKVAGNLTERQIALLGALGMRWESADEEAWSRCYEAARAYYEAHGDLNVKALYITPDGLRLGYWLSRLRQYRKGKIRSACLTPEREAALDAIGMTWDVPDYLFEQNFTAALKYYKAHENLNVPVKYVDENGIRLGLWLNRLRSSYKAGKLTLTEDQIRRLDALGMFWGSRCDVAWENAFLTAKHYYKQHGDLNVPVRYQTEDGNNLGLWIKTQRMNWKNGKLPEERKKRLDALGMIWGRENTIHREAQDAAENQDPDCLPPAVPGAGRALLPAGRGRGSAAHAADLGLHA